MTDTVRLRATIRDSGLKLKYLSAKLGLTPYSLQRKINNVVEFKSSEISALCELLGIDSLEEKERIFFAKEDDLKSM